MPRVPVPFFVQQPADKQLVAVFGLPGTDPEKPTFCRWHDVLGQLVLPDLTMQSMRPGLAWLSTRRVMLYPPMFDFQVPDLQEYVAAGNCSVCAEHRLQQVADWEFFYEMFPTDDDGTQHERQGWLQELFGPDPEPDGDGRVPSCPNCSEPY